MRKLLSLLKTKRSGRRAGFRLIPLFFLCIFLLACFSWVNDTPPLSRAAFPDQSKISSQVEAKPTLTPEITGLPNFAQTTQPPPPNQTDSSIPVPTATPVPAATPAVNPTPLHPTGLKLPSPKELAALPPLKPRAVRSNLPASVDYTYLMPPIGNQGSQGSCTAWATGYYYKTFQEEKKFNWAVNTPLHQYSPAFIYNQINFGADAGSYISDAFQLMIDKGADTLSSFPYNQSNYLLQPTAGQLANAANYKAASRQVLYWQTYDTYGNPYGIDVNLIREHLANGDLVVISIPVYSEFDNATNDYNYQVTHSLSSSAASRGNHAITLIGYDDSRGAFRMANSWGTYWGNGGYTWLSYNFVRYFSQWGEVMVNRNQLQFTSYPTSSAGGSGSATISFNTNRNATATVYKSGAIVGSSSTPATSFAIPVSISNLSLGDNNLTVKIVDSGGVEFNNASLNAPISSVTPPAMPSNLATTTLSKTSIRLSWQDNSSDESGFKIYRWDGSILSFIYWGSVGANVTTFTDSNLNCSAGFSYMVSSYNAFGESNLVGWVDGFTLACISAPTSMTATTVSSTSVNLTWVDNSSEEVGFEIWRKIGSGGSWSIISSPSANATSYTDLAAVPSMLIYYKIRAYNNQGYSDYSNESSTTTSGSMFTLTLDGADVTYYINSLGDANWYTFTVPVTNTYTLDTFVTSPYTLYDSAMYLYGPNNFTYLTYDDDGGAGFASRIVATLTAGTYYVKLQSWGNYYTGTYTIHLRIGSSPTLPSALLASKVSSSRIDLSWTDNSSNETGFSIQRSADNVTWNTPVTVGANVTTYQDTSLLKSATTYYYRIQSYNSAGYSVGLNSSIDYAYSNSATTDPDFTVGSLADTNTSGTFRYSLSHAVPNQSIGFGVTGTINITSPLPSVPYGMTILGSNCSSGSTPVVINGSSGVVLDLGGNVVLKGLDIHGIQIKTTGGSGNKLTCVSVTK
ncbi:C1 family peptidase [Candidatus Chlorohelix sp.]|uniref:C1 family peptidase n=1 Tax=Candidatus Chlorohelix sp. TaxID=3139201 RepID=UPI0030338601